MGDASAARFEGGRHPRRTGFRGPVPSEQNRLHPHRLVTPFPAADVPGTFPVTSRAHGGATQVHLLYDAGSLTTGTYWPEIHRVSLTRKVWQTTTKGQTRTVWPSPAGAVTAC
ncbi:hypothetical protein GCM10010335_12320 [Streptomyces galbus]|nr:hypothetical protein GCM10010335_12320 [Streptomyces galbus]